MLTFVRSGPRSGEPASLRFARSAADAAFQYGLGSAEQIQASRIKTKTK